MVQTAPARGGAARAAHDEGLPGPGGQRLVVPRAWLPELSREQSPMRHSAWNPAPDWDRAKGARQMLLNRKRIVAAMGAAGIAVGALAYGGVPFASAASPAHMHVTATATASASVGRDGACGHMGRMWSGHDPVMKATAGYLGLSQAQLRSELQSGKSLADIAQARGKPVSGLKTTILGAITSWINTSSGLSAGQKAAAISHAKSYIGVIVNMTCRSGMGMHRRG